MTRDPCIWDLLLAHVKWSEGIQQWRAGKRKEGKTQLAAAFLLDHRVLKFWPDARPVPANCPLMGYKEFLEIFRFPIHDGESMGIVCNAVNELFIVISAFSSMAHKKVPNEQKLTSDALRVLDDLLDLLKRYPGLEGTGDGQDLYGCFRTPRLLLLKSHLFQRLGNTKAAMKCLDECLAGKIEPVNAEEDARLTRAMRLADGQAKSDKWLHDEFKLWGEESHPDHQDMYAAYAWLAILTFCDPMPGTYDDVVEYLANARRANERFRQLYGDDEADDRMRDPPPFWDDAHTLLPMEHGGWNDTKICRQAVQERREVDEMKAMMESQDTAVRDEWNEYMRELNLTHMSPVKELGAFCVECGSCERADGSSARIRRCACKLVYYCGDECQARDWEKHKEICKGWQGGREAPRAAAAAVG